MFDKETGNSDQTTWNLINQQFLNLVILDTKGKKILNILYEIITLIFKFSKENVRKNI